MAGGRFFLPGMSAEDVVAQYFDCAHYWRLNPLSLLEAPLSVLTLLIEQGHRIEKARRGHGGI
ncbi:hypothetical protein CJJ18_02395 [Candidatus Williamhamiltonella defendens]|uniref:Uncharacterized protein n=2 Tax=Candidatus Williamhamiltonella defendens TaxID=138072 RepID=A0AAC9VIH5_9ENTR|nr:hypothetical protein CJJ18_02395 [Candidatus Hamiltonella defensa]AWK16086.1 hypothetical protein CCS40_02405 [Candidatus Hamiltonella defensa]